MPKLTNAQGLSDSMAVWLAEDSYDHNDDPMTISATALLKPVKQIVLASRMPPGAGINDISNLIASRLGTAIHESIERSWLNNHVQSLVDLGYPKRAIDLVKINPEPDEIDEDTIAVYMEQRSTKKVGPYTISGKFDFVANGRLEDFKTTGTFTYIKQTNNLKYIQQGSIYRWLNPAIITDDHMAIQFIFTDWQAMMAKSSSNYPKTRVLELVLPLNSVEQTQAFVEAKLAKIEKSMQLAEEDIDPCNDEELWRSEPKFKYYKAGKVSPRSTKNFDSMLDAGNYKTANGGKGLIVEVKGEVKACKYCPAAPICTQKDLYIANGTLKL